MRISTPWQFARSTENIMQHEVDLAKTRERISSGLDLTQAGDDPVRAARALELERTITASEQYVRNTDRAEQRLTLAETHLGEVEDIIQRVRELAIQGANGTLNPDDRHIIASELEQYRNQLLDLANARDANGEYLFAGSRSQTQPFLLNADDSYSYRGDDNQRQLQLTETRRVTVGDSGRAIFMDILNGNGTFAVRHDATINTGSGAINPGTVVDPAAYEALAPAYFNIVMTDGDGDGEVDVYQIDGYEDFNRTVLHPTFVPITDTFASEAEIEFAGIEISIDGTPAPGDTFYVDPSTKQDLFTTVQGLIDTLRAESGTPETRADQRNGFKQALTDLTTGLYHISKSRSEIGGRLRTVMDQQVIHSAVQLRFQETLSAVADADLTEAISDLSRQETALQAAQQTFIRMQSLSLFDRLG